MVNQKNKNPNSIFIWPSSFHPVSGGVQTVAIEIGKFLLKNKWKVKYITNRYPRKLEKNETINSMQIHRFTFLHSPLKYLKSFRIDLVFAWILYKPITCIKLILLFSKIRPNTVNLHFLDNQVFEIFLLKKIFDFKLIISFHGNDIEKISTISTKSFRLFFIGQLLNQAELITGCSNYITNKIAFTFPNLKSEKLTILYNGVGKEFLNTPLKYNKDDYFFSAARNVPVKGLDLIFSLSKRYKQHSFIVAGDGFKRVNNKSNIILLGLVESSEIMRNMINCSMVIIPSRSEAFGIVVAEALCCGSPIVATNVGGIPEVMELAKSSLNQNEICIFDYWVKLVEPSVTSLINGINDIAGSSIPIENYLEIIPKVRKQFSWDKRLNAYHESLLCLSS